MTNEEIGYYFRIANQWDISWNNGKLKGVPWTASDWTTYSKKQFDKDSNKADGSYYWTRNHRVNPAMNVAKDMIGKYVSSGELNKKFGVRPCVWVVYDPTAQSVNSQRWSKFFDVALEVGFEYAKKKYLD